jgi:hypothetical protein
VDKKITGNKMEEKMKKRNKKKRKKGIQWAMRLACGFGKFT